MWKSDYSIPGLILLESSDRRVITKRYYVKYEKCCVNEFLVNMPWKFWIFAMFCVKLIHKSASVLSYLFTITICSSVPPPNSPCVISDEKTSESWNLVCGGYYPFLLSNSFWSFLSSPCQKVRCWSIEESLVMLLGN